MGNFITLLHVHFFFGLLFIFGLTGGIVWLARFGNKEQVKTIVWLAVLVGVLGSLVTTPYSILNYPNMMMGGEMQEFMEQWVGNMMEDTK